MTACDLGGVTKPWEISKQVSTGSPFPIMIRNNKCSKIVKLICLKSVSCFTKYSVICLLLKTNSNVFAIHNKTGAVTNIQEKSHD